LGGIGSELFVVKRKKGKKKKKKKKKTKKKKKKTKKKKRHFQSFEDTQYHIHLRGKAHENRGGGARGKDKRRGGGRRPPMEKFIGVRKGKKSVARKI